MLEIELYKILNEYKQNPTQNNKEELNNFIQNNLIFIQEYIKKPNVDYEVKQILSNLIEKEESQDSNNTEQNYQNTSTKYQQDSLFFKENFEKWSQEYLKNKKITQENEYLIKEIIDKYYPLQIEKINEILEIEQDNIFNDYKNMIRNFLREKITIDIRTYYNNDYKKLPFFKRLKKRKLLHQILNEISEYEFNDEKINEILE